ncbi:glycosyltransferase family 4 protein [Riemerella anatipestifer]|uniref:glycosyltransferase family 4 protein n=1 Tax=Riemerella anatipestifer TaxID=34085 RepID=UPI0021D5F508|nr:glycosyltransferase family 4 protein [Riemerella anatipestifer]MCU7542741.1 glycosyltransferase family 4 protein [Riemerella anatipestifer]MCW0513514.1 glycosyltransferase family 4 protein [Riemerella anatipestifer]
MKSKKILHIVTVSFSISYFLGEQFRYLNKKTGNTYFVACSDSPELFFNAQKLGYLPFSFSITRKINPLGDIKAIFQLMKFIKQNNIDVVVAHSPKGGLIGMIAAFLAGVRSRIYFRHGIVYETSRGTKRFLLKVIEKISGNLAQKVVNVSKDVEDIAIKDRLNSKEKNIILGKGTCNGVDCKVKYNPKFYSQDKVNALKSKYNISDTDFVVGFVGRLVRDKGIDDIIDAWKILSSKYENIKLLLVGPFEERDSIKESNKSYIKNSESIVFTDYVQNTAIFYKLMNIFILPTYREGFPTVALEASSMELPVIITKATGCKEAIIENKTGVFIENSSYSIVSGIEKYINNPNLIQKQGEAGRKFVLDDFQQEKIWDIINKKLDY